MPRWTNWGWASRVRYEDPIKTEECWQRSLPCSISRRDNPASRLAVCLASWIRASRQWMTLSSVWSGSGRRWERLETFHNNTSVYYDKSMIGSQKGWWEQWMMEGWGEGTVPEIAWCHRAVSRLASARVLWARGCHWRVGKRSR